MTHPIHSSAWAPRVPTAILRPGDLREALLTFLLAMPVACGLGELALHLMT